MSFSQDLIHPENYIFSQNRITKYTAMDTSPSGTPSLAHSLLVIPSFPAEMIFGIFPGISIPPAIKRPIRAAFICNGLKLGHISAAVRVALSKIAETIFPH